MFVEDGFQVIRNSMPEDLRCFVVRNFEILKANNFFKNNDGQVKRAHYAYGLPLADSLLEYYLEQVGGVVGKSLHPTYSYTRFYRRGAELTAHVDRPSCEYSATLALDFSANDIWPICLENKSGKTEVIPAPWIKSN